MSDRTERVKDAMRKLGPATCVQICEEARMHDRHVFSALGWLVQTGRATVHKERGLRKVYTLRPEIDKPKQQGYMTPTVVLSGTVASRARLLDPATAARITPKTKYTRGPHCPVYSNVQCLPGEKVPAIFSGRIGRYD